jgi:hypothetical protein
MHKQKSPSNKTNASQEQIKPPSFFWGGINVVEMLMHVHLCCFPVTAAVKYL